MTQNPRTLLALLFVVTIPSCEHPTNSPKRWTLRSPLFGKSSAQQAGTAPVDEQGAAASMPQRERRREASPDVQSAAARFTAPGLWKTSALTWKLDVSDDLPSYLDRSQIEREIRESFAYWSAAGVFSFKQVREGDDADIVIAFNSPKGARFDAIDNRVAYSFYPWTKQKGRIYLDPSERWSTSSFGVTTEAITDWLPHEIGHALGLKHSHRAGDIMNATGPFSRPSRHTFLSLRALYGLGPLPAVEEHFQTQGPLPVSRSTM